MYLYMDVLTYFDMKILFLISIKHGIILLLLYIYSSMYSYFFESDIFSFLEL